MVLAQGCKTLHWNWSTDVLPLSKIRFMIASPPWITKKLRLWQTLFGVLWRCLCHENHFIQMRSQIWIHRAAIWHAKSRCHVTSLLLRKLPLYHGKLVALNHGIFHWTRPQWREWEPANVILRSGDHNNRYFGWFFCCCFLVYADFVGKMCSQHHLNIVVSIYFLDLLAM